MKNSELTTYGVVELSEVEMMEIDGGHPVVIAILIIAGLLIAQEAH